MTRAEFLTGETDPEKQADALQALLDASGLWWCGFTDCGEGHSRLKHIGTDYLDGYDAFPHYQMIRDGNNWRHDV